ncbi:hypothetical protein Hanom_Chr11g01020271 [Helianthus anomalus]
MGLFRRTRVLYLFLNLMVHQYVMCNQTALYWFSTYWFRGFYPFGPLIHSARSYPFGPLIHSALIDSDVAKQPLSLLSINFSCDRKLV